MYAIDRTHKKIIQNDEFQHHGITGQRWGVITRYVGVNYIPKGSNSKKLNNEQKDVIRQYASREMGSMPHSFLDINSKALKKYYERIESNKKFNNGKMSYNSMKREIDKINAETVRKFWKNLKQYEKEHPDLKRGWESYNNYREFLAKNSSIEISKNENGPRLVMSMIDGAPLELCVDYDGLINPTAQTLLMNP